MRWDLGLPGVGVRMGRSAATCAAPRAATAELRTAPTAACRNAPSSALLPQPRPQPTHVPLTSPLRPAAAWRGCTPRRWP